MMMFDFVLFQYKPTDLIFNVKELSINTKKPIGAILVKGREKNIVLIHLEVNFTSIRDDKIKFKDIKIHIVRKDKELNVSDLQLVSLCRVSFMKEIKELERILTKKIVDNIEYKK